MGRSTDAFTGLFVAGIAVLILLAWRTGALNALVARATGQDTSEDATATGVLQPADYLPTAGIAPRLGGGVGKGGGATAGVIDNGVSSSGGDAAAVAAYARGAAEVTAAQLEPTAADARTRLLRLDRELFPLAPLAVDASRAGSMRLS